MWGGESGKRFEDVWAEDETAPVPKSDRAPTPRETLWGAYQDVATELERVSWRISELERQVRDDAAEAELAELRRKKEDLAVRRDELEAEIAKIK